MALLLEVDEEFAGLAHLVLGHVRRVVDRALARLLEVDRGVRERRAEIVLHGRTTAELAVEKRLPRSQLLADLAVVEGKAVGVRDIGHRDDLPVIADRVGGHAALLVARQDVRPVRDLRGIERDDRALARQRILHAAAIVGHGVVKRVAIAHDHLLDRLVRAGGFGDGVDADPGLPFHVGPILRTDLGDARRPELERLLRASRHADRACGVRRPSRP